MTVVRCPVCRSTSKDPPVKFACPECGQALRWAPPGQSATVIQLGLFGDDVPVPHPAKRGQQGALFAALEVAAWQPPRDGSGLAAPASEDVPAPAFRQTHQDALAIVTDLFHNGRGDNTEADLRAASLLDEQSLGSLREIAIAAAWMAAAHLRFIDERWPGKGQQMLESLGLILAEMDE